MIIYSEGYFTSKDGETSIHYNKWMPENEKVKAVVQIAHGVAEYGKRYEPFAEFLAEHGYIVVANDHLGHGKSLIKDAPMVYLGEHSGWWNVVDDVEQLRAMTAEEYPDLPYFLFGHSMGSFISRTHLIRHKGKLDGCILCGTGFLPKPMIAGGKLIANIEIKRLGKKGYSKVADKLAFGAYNKKFAPNRTAFDWVSLNEENVDAYISDPLCGGKTTLGLFRDMLGGLSYINTQKNINTMDQNQPVLFISGDQDPVGEMGKGVKKAYNAFKDAGLKDVKIKLYKGLRHEILNEKEHEEVYEDVLNWLDDHTEK